MSRSNQPKPGITGAIRTGPEVTSLAQERRNGATFRAMQAADEGTFRALLRAVYGDSYSQRELYLPGGYARLLASKRATLAGEFDADGQLVGHVGFLHKDPLADYVEQGMAFRHPHQKSGADRVAQRDAYLAVIAEVATKHSFVHQNVTTQHPLAQRFAQRLIGARSAGFIFDYAVHQSLRAFGVDDEVMSALVMTAPLRSIPARAVTLPETVWGRWIARVYERLQLPRDIVWVSGVPSVSALGRAQAIELECFEANASMGLMRRACVTETDPVTGPVGLVIGPRVDLIHLPLAESIDVAAAFVRLLGDGYLPVAVRPHVSRADEIVFQALEQTLANRVESLANVAIADPADRALLAAWLDATAEADERA